jgi:hypothetical protein
LPIRRWSALPLIPLLTIVLTATPAGASGDPWAGVPEPGAAWTQAELRRINDLLRDELADIRHRMRYQERESTAFIPAAVPATRAHVILLAQLRLDSRRRQDALGQGRPDPGPDPRFEGLWELLRDWSGLLAVLDALRDDDPLDDLRGDRTALLGEDLEHRAELVQTRIGAALIAQIAADTRDPGLLQDYEEAMRPEGADEGGAAADWFPSTRLAELRDQLATLHGLSWARDARPPIGDDATRLVIDRMVHRLGLAALATTDRVEVEALAVERPEAVAAAVRRSRNAVGTLLRIRAGPAAPADPARRAFLRRQLMATRRDLGRQASRVLDLATLAYRGDLNRRLDELDRVADPDEEVLGEADGIIAELDDAPDLPWPGPSASRGPAPSYKVRESLARFFPDLEGGDEGAAAPPVPLPGPPSQPAPEGAVPTVEAPTEVAPARVPPPVEPPPTASIAAVPETPEAIPPKLWAPAADTGAQRVTVLGGPSFLLPGSASTR